MEAAVVKPKPRIRAAVRDGLNRFCLVDKMKVESDKHEGTTQLKRLALISRAHLASFRRSARGIQFDHVYPEWRPQLDLGIGAPKVVFPVDQTEMRGIVKLLAVPIHAEIGYDPYWYKDAACKELKGIENFVNDLHLRSFSDSSAFPEFVECVAPHLKQLECPPFVLGRLPPLDLEKLVLDFTLSGIDYGQLSRHKVRRLDVPMYEIHRHGYLNGQVLSASISSLGLNGSNAINFRHELIETFCRRFSALEELHIFVDYTGPMKALDEHFKNLWTACLELRDQLNVPGLKRFFFTFEHDCNFFTCENSDWIENLKQVEPFDKATFTIGRDSKDVRMFLKHSRPRDAKPVFLHIEGDFEWLAQELEEMNEDSSDSSESSGDDMEDEEESDDEATEENEDLEGSSENAMDQSADEDGMDNADAD
ncbi:hypothetical protein M3Y99_00219300 [Aphelenchoides fujianensis]|nr:hypothetical protein M3Y99_00219300 [Aphelenchoides fujianensis]